MGARTSQTFIGSKHRPHLAHKDTSVTIAVTAPATAPLPELAGLIYLIGTQGEESDDKGVEGSLTRRIGWTFADLNRKPRQTWLPSPPDRGKR